MRSRRSAGFSAGDIHMKGHLCFPWSHALAERPEILDVVEDLIGPDILLFASKFWIKPPRSGRFVSWHQDSAYFGLDPRTPLAAIWIALTESNRANGCMRVIPGSHLGTAHWHRETPDDDNLLGRGQTIEGPRRIEGRRPGASGGASSRSTTSARCTVRCRTGPTGRVSGWRCSTSRPRCARPSVGRAATLVRGVDRFGHWDDEPVPQVDGDPAILEYMRAAQRRYHDPAYTQEASGEA